LPFIVEATIPRLLRRDLGRKERRRKKARQAVIIRSDASKMQGKLLSNNHSPSPGWAS